MSSGQECDLGSVISQQSEDSGIDEDTPVSLTFQGTGGGYVTLGKTGNLGISQVPCCNSSSSQTDGVSQPLPCDLLRYKVSDVPGGGELVALQSQRYPKYYIMGNTNTYTVDGNIPTDGIKDPHTWWRPRQYSEVFPSCPKEGIVLQYWGNESCKLNLFFCIEVHGTTWKFNLKTTVVTKCYGRFDWHLNPCM